MQNTSRLPSPQRPRRTAGTATLIGGLATRHSRSILFALLLVLYVMTAPYAVASIDVVAAAEPAWALATHGSLSLAGIPHSDLMWYFGHDGGIYSDRFPGAIFYLVPAYWAADELGLHAFTLFPGVISATLVTAAAVVLVHDTLQTLTTSRDRVLLASLFVGLGTGAWSIVGHAPWSHTLNFLLIAATLRALSRSSFVWAGFFIGLTVMVRPTMAVAAAVLCIALGVFTRSWRPAIHTAVASIPGVLCLIAYNGLMFGRWGPSNGHELKGDVHLLLGDLPGNVAGALFSPRVGLVVYYPVIVLAVLATRAAWAQATSWERSALLAGLGVMLTQLALNRYTGGEAFFGPRLMVEPLALALPSAARAVWSFHDRGAPHRVAVVTLAIAGVLIHGAGALMADY